MTTSSRSRNSLVLVLSAVLNLRFTFRRCPEPIWRTSRFLPIAQAGKEEVEDVDTDMCSENEMRRDWRALHPSSLGMAHVYYWDAPIHSPVTPRILFFLMLPGVIAVENLGGHPDPCPYYGKDSPEMGRRLSLKPSLSTTSPQASSPLLVNELLAIKVYRPMIAVNPPSSL